MSLRVRLTIGLGFLFLVIFALVLYSSFDVQRLSRDADSIIKDNYDSLVYCKNMIVALDDMRTAVSSRVFLHGPNMKSDFYGHLFETGRSAFESNLAAEGHNITEVHEKDYVAELKSNYSLYADLCARMNGGGATPLQYFDDFLPAYSNVRQTVISINDINMQAIERKNLSARKDSGAMIVSMAVVGTICILLAFFYFWYFPFYVSNTISYLSKKMKELLDGIGIEVDVKTRDEAFMLLQSINLLENRFVKKGKART
jgi:hypothetical protein